MPFLKYGRPVSLDRLTSWTPYFSYTLDKTILNRFVCAHPLPPPSVVRNLKSQAVARQNEKDTRLSVLFILRRVDKKDATLKMVKILVL